MKAISRVRTLRGRFGFATAAAVLVVAAGCAQVEGAATANADAPDLVTSQEAGPTTPAAAQDDTEQPTAPSTEEAPDSDVLSGADAEENCPMVADWDTVEESTELSVGAGIVGFSGGSVGCYESVNILIGASDIEPGYVVRYVDEVAQPGSGDAVPVDGGAVLEVVLGSPTYDPETGEATVHIGDPRHLLEVSGFDVVEQVAFGGSFEGMTTIAIGVVEELPFTVEAQVGAENLRYLTISIAGG